MEPSCIDLYVFAGQSNVLGWGVGPLEMQRVLSGQRRRPRRELRRRGAAVDALELRRSQMEVSAHVDGAEWVDTDGATYRNIHLAAQGHFELGVAVAERLSEIT